MPAGKSDAATAIGALDGPDHGLEVRCILGEHGGEDRLEPLVFRAEADLVIPLITALEAFPPARNLVCGRSLRQRHVVDRILRVRTIIEAADPIEQLRAAVVLR